MCKNDCEECQGETIGSTCVEIKSPVCMNLTEFSVNVSERLTTLEKPHEIDIKTLSESLDLSRDAIIQILIDEIIALKANSTPPQNNTICEGIDWKNNCPNCNEDFCSNLQIFINTMHSKTS